VIGFDLWTDGKTVVKVVTAIFHMLLIPLLSNAHSRLLCR
jgi:hypothetical protein